MASSSEDAASAAGRPLAVRRRWWPWSLAWPRAALRPVASQVLGRGQALHAVRWGGEELLLGCTDRQITVLARRAVAGSDPWSAP
jgi:hypothetical protein